MKLSSPALECGLNLELVSREYNVGGGRIEGGRERKNENMNKWLPKGKPKGTEAPALVPWIT